MNGLEIVGALLTGDTAFGALVPPGALDFWDVPQGAGTETVILHRVSRNEQQFLAPQACQLVTERIQATIRSKSGAERDAIQQAIRDACRDKRPTAEAVTNVSVLLLGDGPDFMDEDASLFMGSTDLRVSFTRTA